MMTRSGLGHVRSAAPQPVAPKSPSARPHTEDFELVPLHDVHVRTGDSLTGSPTVLKPLPPAPQGSEPHDARRFRRRVGNVQINQAHREYRDTWGAQLLAARPSVTADACERKASRMAENAGRSLVRLQPEGLVSMGLTQELTQAKDIIKALRKAGIIDGNSQVSRGAEHSVGDIELSDAVRALRLSNRQELALRDVVIVLKFLYDFGIRQAERVFDLTVCCGANTYARPSTWTEWGYTLAHLFDAKADDDAHRALLEARRAALM